MSTGGTFPCSIKGESQKHEISAGSMKPPKLRTKAGDPRKVSANSSQDGFSGTVGSLIPGLDVHPLRFL